MILSRITKILCVFLFVQVSVWVMTAGAETRYVSDVLIITLRAGPGNEYEVLKTLKTDTPFEVLEADGGYFKIRTTTDEEGWVPVRYTTTDTPKRTIIAGLERKTSRLEAKIDKLEETRGALSEALTKAKQAFSLKETSYKSAKNENLQDISEIKKDLDDITKKYNALYSDSKNVVALAEEKKKLADQNKEFMEENRLLNIQVKILKKERANLLSTGLMKWFLVGAGVLLTGVLFGKVSTKKKKTYY